MAQAIARQTTTQGRSAEEYRDIFMGRFRALIEAEDLAFAEHEAIGLGNLLERVFAPYSADQEAVVIEPSLAIELPPRKIQPLSLVLHELATNAAKYGALSVSGGQVRVSWQVEDTSKLRLKWVESGGPPVSPPTKTGYGTKLIKTTTTYSLQGHVQQEYANGGFRAEIVIPLGGASPSGNSADLAS